MHDYRVLVGANGWRHPQWQGEFYPDDLPADWQLGFYGNEFRVVLLSSSDTLTPEQVADWCHSSPEAPGFIVEWSPRWRDETQLAPVSEALRCFGERLLGILVPASLFSEPINLPRFAQLVAGYRVCVDMSAVADKAVHHVVELFPRWGRCWHGQGDGRELQRGELAIARISGQDLSMKALRQVLQSVLAAQDPQRYLVVIYDGDPPSVSKMRQALTMLELL